MPVFYHCILPIVPAAPPSKNFSPILASVYYVKRREGAVFNLRLVNQGVFREEKGFLFQELIMKITLLKICDKAGTDLTAHFV